MGEFQDFTGNGIITDRQTETVNTNLLPNLAEFQSPSSWNECQCCIEA